MQVITKQLLVKQTSKADTIVTKITKVNPTFCEQVDDYRYLGPRF